MVEEKILIELGLTEIEAKIYLANLELGPDTVLHIAKKAEVKRPTAYVTLDNLTKKGFVAKVERKTTTLYTPEDPEIILNKYQEKIANFTDMLPYFRAKFSKGPRPKIKMYEGREELWEIYTHIFFTSDEQYYLGTNYDKLEEKLPGLLDHWSDKGRANVKDYKEIIMPSEYSRQFVAKHKTQKGARFMPKDLPVFADAVISKNKIFIVSLDNLFGVLIESEDLAKTFKNFFLLAWRAADKIT